MLGESGSRPGFFSTGVTDASFREEGTSPEDREEFTVVVMRVERVGRQAFRSVVGSGSRLQVDDFMVETVEERSEEVMVANVEKD